MEMFIFFFRKTINFIKQNTAASNIIPEET